MTPTSATASPARRRCRGSRLLELRWPASAVASIPREREAAARRAVAGVELRTVFTGAACTVDDAEFPGFGCMVDDRPVDGSLVELRVAPEPYPSYDYGATVRTAGRRLDGREYETTEAFEGLILR